MKLKNLREAALCGALSLSGPEALPARTLTVGAQAQDEKVSAWIEKLGVQDQEVRERAWDALLERGREALPDLDRAGREAKDPEVRWNARLLAREIRRTDG